MDDCPRSGDTLGGRVRGHEVVRNRKPMGMAGVDALRDVRLRLREPSSAESIRADSVSSPASRFSRLPDIHEYPGGPLPWEATEVILTPARTIAPVGSDVVLLAGVRGRDDYLRTNERVDWLIEPGGVGEIVDYAPGTWTDLMLGDFTWPRRVAPNWAITSTSRRYLRLNRETPVASDDVNVLAGQTWVTVTSAVEGDQLRDGVGPGRLRMARPKADGHDLLGRRPVEFPVAGDSFGRRQAGAHDDGHPAQRSRAVRRLDASATRSPTARRPDSRPTGGPSIEVATNETGQGSAEIVQVQPAAGTNRINIQVIRPATLGWLVRPAAGDRQRRHDGHLECPGTVGPKDRAGVGRRRRRGHLPDRRDQLRATCPPTTCW